MISLQSCFTLTFQIGDSVLKTTDNILYCSQCTMGFSNTISLSEHVHHIHGINLTAKPATPLHSPGMFTEML